MQKTADLYLEDILEMIRRIEKSASDATFSEFEDDVDLQDASIRRIEIIGEAVKHVPKDFQEKYPKISWRKIAGTRDVLIHAYSDVVLKGVWNIITKDLPKLKKQIQKILKDPNGK